MIDTIAIQVRERNGVVIGRWIADKLIENLDNQIAGGENTVNLSLYI